MFLSRKSLGTHTATTLAATCTASSSVGHTIELKRKATAIALALGMTAATAMAADEAFVCMEETQEICDQNNRNMALFIKGRDAFDQGREIGDFGEARRYALELMANNDSQHGSALMKFIYVQVGLGVHKNLVEAYRWVAADMAAGRT